MEKGRRGEGEKGRKRDFSLEIQNLRVAVIGAARSGVAAAKALKRLGAEPLLSDAKSEDKLDPELLAELRESGIECIFSATVEQALAIDNRKSKIENPNWW